MKEKKLFDALTNIPDELVEEARKTKLKPTVRPWKKWTALAACVALAIVMVSILPRGGSPSEGALLDVVLPKAYAYDDFGAKQAAIDVNPVDDAFLKALDEFSYKTASQIVAGQSGNTNYSPLSLYYALAMAASGAEGETADELLSLLGVSDPSTLSKQSGNLYRQLYTDNAIAKLKIANSLWMNKKVSWKNKFIKNAAANFYTSSFSMDFSDKKTGEEMAKWVSEHTDGILKPEIEITQDQILSILNTVYFYDEWVNKFKEAETTEDAFYLSDGSTEHSNFMNAKYASADFAKGEGFTRSALSLKNDSRMVFILPDEGVSPQELLSSPEKAKAAFEGGQDGHGEVVWQIPKFRFGTKLDLKDALIRLGLTSAFEQNADFSGITDKRASLTGVRQETHIGIDENGVEASAFTEILYAGGAAPLSKDRAEMVLNRPFIYGITAPNGALLFIGICENPLEK
ncbi:serpin family protein [Cohnella sp. AR92]|uniref:serpin family protein n=1 Tax=Cohnella sp. AR92 TaxID=648716 RepID=UPI000F8C3959|nr:serpin family protein [Cohnella sp. AR92]RUS46527.1 serpin family protein [Cohnella sp. AR92]